jgi:hypothetical protein
MTLLPGGDVPTRQGLQQRFAVPAPASWCVLLRPHRSCAIAMCRRTSPSARDSLCLRGPRFLRRYARLATFNKVYSRIKNHQIARLGANGYVVPILARVVTPIEHTEPLPTVENSAPGISGRVGVQSMPTLDQSTPQLGSSGAASSAEKLGPPDDARAETLADCLSFWNSGTHMSKDEWRRTCERTMNGRCF